MHKILDHKENPDFIPPGQLKDSKSNGNGKDNSIKNSNGHANSVNYITIIMPFRSARWSGFMKKWILPSLIIFVSILISCCSALNGGLVNKIKKLESELEDTMQKYEETKLSYKILSAENIDLKAEYKQIQEELSAANDKVKQMEKVMKIIEK